MVVPAVTCPLIRGWRGGCGRLLRRPRPWSQAYGGSVQFSSSSPAQDDEHNQKSVLVEMERVGDGHGVVANFRLNRPRSQNALNSEVIGELQDAFRVIAKDPQVRAVVVRGQGAVFCGGHDLYQLHDLHRDRAYFERLFTQCSRLMMTIQRIPQPVIASVHGLATGAGCQLVAACDLAVASDDAQFATSGIKLGLFCATPCVPLSRNIPRKRAFEMLVTGDFIDANTALDFGLVNRVVPRDKLDKAVEQLVSSIAAKPRVAIDVGKKFFYQQIEKPYAAALDLADFTMAYNMVQRDTEEGIAAFVEKRQPDWDL